MIGRLALHFFFPQSCPVCGELGQDICPQCLKSALEVNPLPHCLVCGKASPCEQHGTRYTVTALCRHKGRARDILLAAKYGQRGRLAYQMGREL
ncbi:MAG: double zinc ribbon domain-containing protein, partial [Pyramidobacter sp.]|nr:double zinc ribbon domain-containing protein [Pyramidobacter sp.]